MKKTIITGSIIMVTVGLLAAIVWGSKDQGELASSKSDQKEVAGLSGEVENEAPIFFYGSTCPHCKDVEEWIKKNRVDEKLEIVRKEVYDDRANALELRQAAESCGLPTNSIGVPFLYTSEGKCLIGTPDIIDYLSSQIELSAEDEVENSPEATEAAERIQP